MVMRYVFLSLRFHLSFLFFQVVGHVPLLTWIHTRVACCASAIVHKTFLFSSFFTCT